MIFFYEHLCGPNIILNAQTTISLYLVLVTLIADSPFWMHIGENALFLCPHVCKDKGRGSVYLWRWSGLTCNWKDVGSIPGSLS